MADFGEQSEAGKALAALQEAGLAAIVWPAVWPEGFGYGNIRSRHVS